MGRARFGWLSIGLSTLVLVGCGDGTPPLDELPLRDTLRADPAVVAALDDSARRRLAARFEGAADDATSDVIADGPTPAAEVTSLDEARGRRAADALVVGTIRGGVARPVAVVASSQTPLPQLEGEVATTTAALESRALGGAAGARLRALLQASGAQRLERVAGWPAGAVAIGETVYVDASWLVALAPVEGGVDGPDAGDAGAPGATPSGRAGGDSTLAEVAASSSPIAQVSSAASFDGGCPPDAINCSRFDAGAFTPAPTPPPPPPPSGPSFWDACAAGSGCAASSDSCDSSDSEDDACSGTDDGSDSSCSGTDDGSSDACSTPPDDGSDCRVSPGRERPRAATIVWVLAPLGFLIGRRR
jgi:hypothetical protein